MTSTVGLVGLAVMGQVRLRPRLPSPVWSPYPYADLRLRDGIMLRAPELNARTPAQNLALNVAEKGFPISVYNRTYSKTEAAVARAQKSGAHCRCPSRDNIMCRLSTACRQM